jgi:hypothetical protein
MASRLSPQGGALQLREWPGISYPELADTDTDNRRPGLGEISHKPLRGKDLR